MSNGRKLAPRIGAIYGDDDGKLLLPVNEDHSSSGMVSAEW